MAIQEMVDGCVHCTSDIRTLAAIGGLRRKACRHQHNVGLSGWHFKRLDELPYRVSAGLPAPGFEKSERAL